MIKIVVQFLNVSDILVKVEVFELFLYYMYIKTVEAKEQKNNLNLKTFEINNYYSAFKG